MVLIGKIFTDKQSGINKNREGLDSAISHLRKDDVQVIWKLDRLGRKVKDLIELIERFKESIVRKNFVGG